MDRRPSATFEEADVRLLSAARWRWYHRLEVLLYLAFAEFLAYVLLGIHFGRMFDYAGPSRGEPWLNVVLLQIPFFASFVGVTTKRWSGHLPPLKSSRGEWLYTVALTALFAIVVSILGESFLAIAADMEQSRP